ncbi:Hypothetical protein SMAX5B_008059 [Scophthalmus maximus]|uniref:Uncharacterized protein n=1 Tax=Scophthalmus maximus TaxID=52904 RepID=A0A2U9BET7_SCOMX|nr:Hypothetical protein SMAX5B_008059 [Scophthalmus maximus]
MFRVSCRRRPRSRAGRSLATGARSRRDGRNAICEPELDRYRSSEAGVDIGDFNTDASDDIYMNLSMIRNTSLSDLL